MRGNMEVKSSNISKYTEAAILHGEATLSGDYKKANHQYKIMSECYNNIKNSSDELIEFSKLLYHSNDSVKVWAASHYLSHNKAIAVKVLKEVAKGEGIIAFGAKVFLENM